LATKEEIVAGIGEVRQRLRRLEPQIVANLDKPLLTGTWTVRDALCHIAADANAVARWRSRLEGQSPGRPPGMSGEEHNQQQIDARKARPVEDVLREIQEGLDEDARAVEEMEEALLQRQMQSFRGETIASSDMLRFYTAGHNQMHLDDIDAAISMAASSRGE